MRRNPQVTFLGMAGRDTEDAMQDFVETYELQEMPHAVSVDGSLWAQFGVPFQPAWIFIDDDGTVTRIQGAPPAEDVQAQLDSLKDS